jgi:hypothetical protein
MIVSQTTTVPRWYKGRWPADLLVLTAGRTDGF